MERVVGGVADLGLGAEAVGPGHVGPEDLPVAAAVGELEQVVAAQIDDGRIVHRDLERRVPVPTELVTALGARVLGVRLHALVLPRVHIEAADVAELVFAVTDLRAVR